MWLLTIHHMKPQIKYPCGFWCVWTGVFVIDIHWMFKFTAWIHFHFCRKIHTTELYRCGWRIFQLHNTQQIECRRLIFTDQAEFLFHHYTVSDWSLYVKCSFRECKQPCGRDVEKLLFFEVTIVAIFYSCSSSDLSEYWQLGMTFIPCHGTVSAYWISIAWTKEKESIYFVWCFWRGANRWHRYEKEQTSTCW